MFSPNQVCNWAANCIISALCGCCACRTEVGYLRFLFIFMLIVIWYCHVGYPYIYAD